MKAKIALAQMSFVNDRDRNVEKGVRMVKQAASEGAEIICLPELATGIYFCYQMNTKWFDLAERVPGPSTEAMAAAAREANAYVLFPLYEKVQAGELYNTAVFINPRGEIVGKYRKLMIPLAETPTMSGYEKYYFRPGNLGYPVWPTEVGVKVGCTICFDRHFPEGPRCLALGGADVMFVPTATATGKEMWELELRAHSVANLFWVGGVNRVLKDEDGGPAQFYGRSLVTAPNGEIVAQAGEDGDAIVHAEIDTELSRQLRDEWGFFRDRRPDAYSLVTAP